MSRVRALGRWRPRFPRDVSGRSRTCPTLARGAGCCAHCAGVGCCTNIKTQKKTDASDTTVHTTSAHMCATAACMRPCEKNANQANPCCLSGGGARRARGRPATRACALRPARCRVRATVKKRWSSEMVHRSVSTEPGSRPCGALAVGVTFCVEHGGQQPNLTARGSDDGAAPARGACAAAPARRRRRRRIGRGST